MVADSLSSSIKKKLDRETGEKDAFNLAVLLIAVALICKCSPCLNLVIRILLLLIGFGGNNSFNSLGVKLLFLYVPVKSAVVILIVEEELLITFNSNL